MTRIVLSIAGSDTWGGGGIATDLRVMQDAGVFGLSVITCIAVQGESTFDIVPLDKQLIQQQLLTIQSSFKIDAVKIGFLPTQDSIALTHTFCQQLDCPIIVDPVMALKETQTDFSKYIHQLSELMKQASLITPNLQEACYLAECDIKSRLDIEKACYRIYERVHCPILIKGGDRLPGEWAVDVYYDGKQIVYYELPKIKSKNVHGAGCGLSTMIAAQMAQDSSIQEAITKSKQYIYDSIQQGISLDFQEGGNIWNRRKL